MKAENKAFFLSLISLILFLGFLSRKSKAITDLPDWELVGTHEAREERKKEVWDFRKTQTFLNADFSWNGGVSPYPSGLHEGTDYACNIGEEIRTIKAGKVVFSGNTSTGFGNTVIIDAGGTLIKYSHLDSIFIQIGWEVNENQTIGTCGNTGFSTGSHLHLECRSNGLLVDCSDYETMIKNYREKAVTACWQWREKEIDCHALYEEVKALNIDYFEGLAVMNFHAVKDAESQGMYSITDRKAEVMGVNKNEILRHRKKLMKLYYQNLTGETLAVSGVTLLNHSKEQNDYIKYAYEISGNDKIFLYMLKAENGLISPTTKHKWDGPGTQGWGFCGITSPFHNDLINDSRFFTDWRWQMDQCFRLYSNGTTFYGLKALKSSSKYLDQISSHFIFN